MPFSDRISLRKSVPGAATPIDDDTTAIGKRLREITGETTKAKVVKIDCIHCRDVGWVRSGQSALDRGCPIVSDGYLVISPTIELREAQHQESAPPL